MRDSLLSWTVDNFETEVTQRIYPPGLARVKLPRFCPIAEIQVVGVYGGVHRKQDVSVSREAFHNGKEFFFSGRVAKFGFFKLS